MQSTKLKGLPLFVFLILCWHMEEGETASDPKMTVDGEQRSARTSLLTGNISDNSQQQAQPEESPSKTDRLENDLKHHNHTEKPRLEPPFKALNFGAYCNSSQDCRSMAKCDARKAGERKKCRMLLGAINCRYDEDCTEEAICDFQNQCRIKKWAKCDHLPGLCLTGGMCTDGMCACNPRVTNWMSLKCEATPWKSSASCITLPKIPSCEDPNAKCEDGMCQCKPPLSLDTQHLLCRVNAGQECKTGKKAIPCITGASCVNGICLLEKGEQCIGDRGGYCMAGGFCSSRGLCELGIQASRSKARSNNTVVTVLWDFLLIYIFGFIILGGVFWSPLQI